MPGMKYPESLDETHCADLALRKVLAYRICPSTLEGMCSHITGTVKTGVYLAMSLTQHQNMARSI